MKNGKKSYCFFAVMTMVVVMVLMAVMRGYNVAQWDVVSWISGIFIAIAVFVCVNCRLLSEKENKAG